MDYQKQGSDFLKKHDIVMKVKFLRHGPHFIDDKESRDIFKVVFSRNKQKYFLTFGQSIAESTGSGGKPPTAYDVLSCLTKYDPGSFKNFCNDYGYDSDSRKAEKIYKLVKKDWSNINKFFTEEEITELQEIQ